ncbi:hypothetical protein LINGRAHAP2_LOCUS6533 [Linum grandiflorum]
MDFVWLGSWIFGQPTFKLIPKLWFLISKETPRLMLATGLALWNLNIYSN